MSDPQAEWDTHFTKFTLPAMAHSLALMFHKCEGSWEGARAAFLAIHKASGSPMTENELRAIERRAQDMLVEQGHMIRG